MWGGRCPYCGEVFRGLKDNVTMGEHRAPWYAIGGNRRVRCPYGGGTVADAQKRISPLMRRTQAHIVKLCRIEQREMTLDEKALMAERDMLTETLEMIGDQG